MSLIVNKKLKALKEIIKSYENYKGKTTSRLEQELYKIQNKLTKQEFERLLKAFNDYTEYILIQIANTKKVYVQVDKNYNEFEDLQKVFEDLDE